VSDAAVDGVGRLAVTPTAGERLLTSVGSHRRLLELLVAIAVYFGFACYFTWPLVTGLSHTFYGAAGDPYGTMSFFRELVAHHYNPFLPGTISQLSAPEGQAIPWTRDLASMPGILTLYTLTAAFGATPAYGLYALLGYTLSGLAMFLFVRRLTGNVWASLIAGWAFAFYPYAIINGQGHDDNIQGWALVLGVWRMIELMHAPSRRNAVLAGLAVAFGMWWTPYFILLGGVAYVAAAIGSLAVAWRAGRLRRMLGPQAITAGIVVVFLGFLVVLSTGPQGNSTGVRVNGIAALNTYSARPWEYVVPDAQSPLFGGDTANFLETHIHGSNAAESTLYVGVTVILLALVACWALVRRRLPPRLAASVLVLALIALAALITSAPPEARVFGVLVPFPGHFIAKVTTTWRVYARFVILAMLALAALAGVGLHVLVRRRSWWVAGAILLCASVLVPLDLWSRLGGRTNTIEVPRLYSELGRQPAGLVASYPLTPVGENNYGELFFRNVVKKPMINGYLEGTAEERRALSLADLSDPSTAPRLAALGVSYVIVEATPPGYGLAPPGRPGRGFRLLYDESYGAVYRVTAAPSGPALATPGEGFGEDEPSPTGTFNWLLSPSGTVEFAGHCVHCDGVLTMTIASFAKPRMVVVYGPSGEVLVRRRVAEPTTLSVPVTFTHDGSVRIATTPGPQSIKKTIPSTDPRSVSVQVSNLQFTAVGAPTRLRGS
jgi:hypothetical protein